MKIEIGMLNNALKVIGSHANWRNKFTQYFEKDAVVAEVFGNEKKPEYHKIVRNPYMLEFIDFTLRQDKNISE